MAEQPAAVGKPQIWFLGHWAEVVQAAPPSAGEPLLLPLDVPLEEPLDEPLAVPLEEPLDDPLAVPLEEPLLLPLDVPLEEPLLAPLEDPLPLPLAASLLASPPPSSALPVLKATPPQALAAIVSRTPQVRRLMGSAYSERRARPRAAEVVWNQGIAGGPCSPSPTTLVSRLCHIASCRPHRRAGVSSPRELDRHLLQGAVMSKRCLLTMALLGLVCGCAGSTATPGAEALPPLPEDDPATSASHAEYPADSVGRCCYVVGARGCS